jgi:hypothetical protein
MISNSVLRSTAFVLFAVFVVFAGMACGGSDNTTGYRAFSGCTGLTSVTIGNSVTTIGSEVFRNCTGLVSVTVLAEVPPTLFLSDAFNNTHASLQIFVPAGSVDAYKAAESWSALADRIVAIIP